MRPFPHICSSVGYRVVCCCRSFHNLHADKRNQLHAFFLCTIRRRGVVRQPKVKAYETCVFHAMGRGRLFVGRNFRQTDARAPRVVLRRWRAVSDTTVHVREGCLGRSEAVPSCLLSFGRFERLPTGAETVAPRQTPDVGLPYGTPDRNKREPLIK